GGAPRIAFIVGVRGDFAGKADGAVDEAPQAVTPGLRHSAALIQPRMQISRERRLRAMASDRALERIERDDVAGAFPDRAEMRITQQPCGGELLDIASAAAHLHGIATDLA